MERSEDERLFLDFRPGKVGKGSKEQSSDMRDAIEETKRAIRKAFDGKREMVDASK